MAVKGPRPMASKVHQLRGNPSKLRAQELKDLIDPKIEVPPCPGYLRGEAGKEWVRLSKILLDIGIIAQADRVAMATYCSMWADFVDARSELDRMDPSEWVVINANGADKVTPWLRISREAATTLLRFANEFGLSPAARARIPTKKNPDHATNKKNYITS